MTHDAPTDEVHQPVLPFEDFRQAAAAVLSRLHADLGFGLWLLTRTVDEDWIVLDAEDHAYGVEEGDVFRWSAQTVADDHLYEHKRRLPPPLTT